MTSSSSKSPDTHPLDSLTGGAFSAPTSGERAARIRSWLVGNPPADQMHEVFKELTSRDKGAARPLREKLEELRRGKAQEVLASEWADKAQSLLALSRLNIADAMAWQRDAAKAGAPLSKEPLATLKLELAARIKRIEDLQHQVQIQREAAVLLAQRIELLSTKPWRDAHGAAAALTRDELAWQGQTAGLQEQADWASVDLKFPSMLEGSRTQLHAVWEAFQGALAQAVAAAADSAAPLPSVPVWAGELRAERGLAEVPQTQAAKPGVDPQIRARAAELVGQYLAKLEGEIAEGHGKASAGAAAALRNSLKEHGRLIDPALENRSNAALAAAGELESWQRWRADQLREALVARAEGLFEQAGAAAEAGTVVPAPKPRLGGRKMQETLRELREQWKQTDQGGVPNHALWRRFDEACNRAYKVVEAWLEAMKAQSAEHRAQRLALIAEVNAWAEENRSAKDGDWRGFHRLVHQFGDRWRDAGHLGEKAFAELQPQWKAAIHQAAAPLEAEQQGSSTLRHSLIEEATALGAAPMLRVDALRSLQQRWQQEAQRVPLERKHEQRLWEAFRKPIDEAFARKDEERAKAAAALSEHDRAVLHAAKDLEEATAQGDPQKIRIAMAALEAVGRTRPAVAAGASVPISLSTAPAEQDAPVQPAESDAAAIENVAAASADDAALDAPAAAEPEDPAPKVASKPAPRPVVAMRGDDRPGARKGATRPAATGLRSGDRPGGPRGASPRDGKGPRTGENKFEPWRDDRGGRSGDRPAPEDRGPRLGDAAFRAQRDALERAQLAMKKLAARVHGEALTQLLAAWEQRSSDALPSAQELGRAVSPTVRAAWAQAMQSESTGGEGEALLRLEMASEAATPAEHIDARRALQLQLLTRRNEPPPTQTWGQDVARVLGTAYDAANARRLQTALKILLRK